VLGRFVLQSQLLLLGPDLSHELLNLLIKGLLIAHVRALVLQDLLGLLLYPLRLPLRVLLRPLSLRQLSL
jgi:hypothetical protein